MDLDVGSDGRLESSSATIGVHSPLWPRQLVTQATQTGDMAGPMTPAATTAHLRLPSACLIACYLCCTCIPVGAHHKTMPEACIWLWTSAEALLGQSFQQEHYFLLSPPPPPPPPPHHLCGATDTASGTYTFNIPVRQYSLATFLPAPEAVSSAQPGRRGGGGGLACAR